MKGLLSGAADVGSYGAGLTRAPVGPGAAYSALPPLPTRSAPARATRTKTRGRPAQHRWCATDPQVTARGQLVQVFHWRQRAKVVGVAVTIDTAPAVASGSKTCSSAA